MACSTGASSHGNKSRRLTVLCKQSGALFSSTRCVLHHLIWFDFSRDKQEMQFKISCLSSWLKGGKGPFGQKQIARLNYASQFCKWGNSVKKTLLYESPVVRPLYLCHFGQLAAPRWPSNYLSFAKESTSVVLKGVWSRRFELCCGLRFLTLCSIPPSFLPVTSETCTQQVWLAHALPCRYSCFPLNFLLFHAVSPGFQSASEIKQEVCVLVTIWFPDVSVTSACNPIQGANPLLSLLRTSPGGIRTGAAQKVAAC